MMLRLADYFVVVGFNHDRKKSEINEGVVEQRYPLTDWDDVPFFEGIESYCQPQGWSLSTERLKPMFFVAVLTDITGSRHNAAILTFMDSIGFDKHHSLTYAPRCLVLTARHDHINLLRQCLGLIYTAHVDRFETPLEKMVGNVLGSVLIPPPGSPPTRFSLGAGDLQIIQSQKFANVPVTGTSVHSLCSQLSAYNVVQLLCAAMSELKIVLFSRRYQRLQQSCHALVSLMYPFKYRQVYIPLLPSALIEVLHAPTPFIIGCHSSLRDQIHDVYDVIMADLDSGYLDIPPSVRIPTLPDALLQTLYADMCDALHPSFSTADDAFPSDAAGSFNKSAANNSPELNSKRTDPHAVDKQIRAIFVRMFAQILQGYRRCLIVVRIHPQPLFKFNRVAFLSLLDTTKNKSDFIEELIESMFFQHFIEERASPFRSCDLFDDIYSEIENVTCREKQILDIGKLLYENEYDGSTSVWWVPQPSQEAIPSNYQRPFPRLIDRHVTEAIEQNAARIRLLMIAESGDESEKYQIVPDARSIEWSNIQVEMETDLKVLRKCIRQILAKRDLAKAQKYLPGALHALNYPSARVALSYELQRQVGATNNRVEVDSEAFELIVNLMNAALEDDPTSHNDNAMRVAILLLPLTQSIYRRSAKGVIQYAYGFVQKHKVWTSLELWQIAFYQDLERNLMNQYQEECEFPSTALELCATQTRLTRDNRPDTSQINALASIEEQVIFTLAVEYVYLIACLRIPSDFHPSRGGPDASGNDKMNLKGSKNNLIRDADSVNSEGSFGVSSDNFSDTLTQDIIKFIYRFIDRVCIETGVTGQHIDKLRSMIPCHVDMQLDKIRAIYNENENTSTAKILQASSGSVKTVFEGIRDLRETEKRTTSIWYAENRLE